MAQDTEKLGRPRAKRKAEGSRPHAKSQRPTRARSRRLRSWQERTWTEAFLAALSVFPSIPAAARAAKIDHTEVYRLRNSDPGFAKAIEQHFDLGLSNAKFYAEGEAFVRALKGWEEPVFYQGKKCGSVRKYDSALHRDILRAHIPERYRERFDVNLVRDEAKRFAEASGLSAEDAAEIIAVAQRIVKSTQSIKPQETPAESEAA